MPINVNGVPSYPVPGTTRSDSVSSGFERVSSGTRINSADDDAAGLSISSRFSKEISGLSVAARNAGDGISLTQVADGALQSLNENVARIRELALGAANGTLNDQDRQALATEADQLNGENRRLIENTAFNGVSLFDSQESLSFQIGPNTEDNLSVPGNDLAQALDGIGLNSIDIATREGANEALSVLDEASRAISAQAGEFGALAKRFEATADTLESSRVSASEARSRTEDADLAQELADISAGQVRDQVGIAVQSQANSNQDVVLQLLQP